MSRVTPQYEQMVKSMDKMAAVLDRVQAARGPSARQRAEHEKEMEQLRAQRAARGKGNR
jgi:hypothetical protein